MSPATVAGIEADLLDAAGLAPWLARAGLDATTRGGANPALRAPIREALRRAGVAVADPFVPADSDLAGLDEADLERVLRTAELLAVERIQLRWPEAEARARARDAGGDPAALDARLAAEARALDGLADRLRRLVESRHSDALPGLTSGTFRPRHAARPRGCP